MYEIRAGNINIASIKHGINDGQLSDISGMSNDALTGFNLSDPISSHGLDGGLRVTGGHHRLHEISRRVSSGAMSPDTKVRILLHD